MSKEIKLSKLETISLASGMIAPAAGLITGGALICNGLANHNENQVTAGMKVFACGLFAGGLSLSYTAGSLLYKLNRYESGEVNSN